MSQINPVACAERQALLPAAISDLQRKVENLSGLVESLRNKLRIPDEQSKGAGGEPKTPPMLVQERAEQLIGISIGIERQCGILEEIIKAVNEI